jgi:hypothetical protein
VQPGGPLPKTSAGVSFLVAEYRRDEHSRDERGGHGKVVVDRIKQLELQRRHVSTPNIVMSNGLEVEWSNVTVTTDSLGGMSRLTPPATPTSVQVWPV